MSRSCSCWMSLAAGWISPASERLLTMVRKLAQRETMSIIYVTHHTEELLLECFEQTLFLKDSLVYKKGPTEDLFSQASVQ